MQPLISKIILPWFGGAAGVWTTCMLFFQIVLFLGYDYAHFTTRRLKPSVAGTLHTILLILMVFLVRIRPSADWRPDGEDDPIVGILRLCPSMSGCPSSYWLRPARSSKSGGTVPSPPGRCIGCMRSRTSGRYWHWFHISFLLSRLFRSAHK